MSSLILNHNKKPFLFLGDMHNAYDRQDIDSNNIKYIINCTDDIPNKYDDIIYLRIPVYDNSGEDISVYFDKAISFINEARDNDQSILVHCMAGVSRSATIVIEYLSSRRPCICPNEGFFHQLRRRIGGPNYTYESFISDIYYKERNTIGSEVIDIMK
jgi:dual specificity MAP kinase phosphatase